MERHLKYGPVSDPCVERVPILLCTRHSGMISVITFQRLTSLGVHCLMNLSTTTWIRIMTAKRFLFQPASHTDPRLAPTKRRSANERESMTFFG